MSVACVRGCHYNNDESSLVNNGGTEIISTAHGPRALGELEGWAQAELRSVNGQIEYILRQAVNKRKGEKPVPPEAESGQKET